MLSEMIDIFSILEDKNINLGDFEKARKKKESSFKMKQKRSTKNGTTKKNILETLQLNDLTNDTDDNLYFEEIQP